MHPDYLKIRQDFENSLGYKIYRIIKELDTFIIFMEKNFNCILKEIKYYKNNSSDLWAISDLYNFY